VHLFCDFRKDIVAVYETSCSNECKSAEETPERNRLDKHDAYVENEHADEKYSPSDSVFCFLRHLRFLLNVRYLTFTV